MKKINKFLTIFGAIAPISALPFIAAKCDTSDSSSTINKEDDKNNKNDNKNNPEVNISTNTDTGNKDGGQGNNSTPSENSQATPGSSEESNNNETAPNSENGNSNESGGGNSPIEEMALMTDETAPSGMPTEHETPNAPETSESSRTHESNQPSGHEGNSTPGSGTEGTTPGNGEGANRDDQPMSDDPSSSSSSNSDATTVKSKAEKELELLYQFFEGYGQIDEYLKDKSKLEKLKSEFDSKSNETIDKFDHDTEEFLKKFGFQEQDITDLADIFDHVTSLTFSNPDETASKNFTDLFKKVKGKLTEAYNKYTKKEK
ncbi:Hypothetical protein, predicted lipoprotein [Mycoplasmopsis agalactiae 14628]|uniref:Uncharacterized protein n=1 Tax=Mycoplasmopsis agalactiae 14628 TaxID=1110504 RepID=I5D6R5_MYCAA|nr:variable surface lipoprotein [Mycoplasmopsis agalactiae]EIN15374.1 Hypothetical protein, predicted lipoprotein [Mycoplasmopsis agalactiae 14628]